MDSVDPETKSSNRGYNTPADSFVDLEQILSDSDPFAQSDCSDRDPCYIPESETSHYSDSEPEIVQREQEYLINKSQDIPEVENSNSEIVENINIQENNTLTRKRRYEPQTWKRNKNKKLRLEGKEHTSQSGKKVRAKAVQEVPCKCHYKCNDLFTLNDRQIIFNDFLTLKEDRAKWAFINSSVSKELPKRRYKSKDSSSMAVDVPDKRNYTHVYSLTLNNKVHQVCKMFFLGTLDISAKRVETALKKKMNSGVTEHDKRGLNPAPNKISEEQKNSVRDHIKSLPVVDSHYCRCSSKRKYLPSGLSENRLYQDYINYCEENGALPVSSYYYKHIFTTEFNYGFHRPKKDQCDYCAQFKNKSPEEKLQEQSNYELHLIRKTEAREQKKEDKARAKTDPTFCAYTMDLEKILLTPQLEIGQLYYKRKLKTYNFTIYDLGKGTAINYMWHETNGTKGSSEIATCIWKLLSELPLDVTEVTFYSDTASGQNRNHIISAMFIKALSSFPNLKIINQKYMESGHSEMECDSVHSAIESRGRKINIFVPDGWYTVARTAKTTRPSYVVKEMDFSQFLDFKSYSQKLITNKNKGENGIMKWLLVKWLQYRGEEPMHIYYKTQLSQIEFERICIRLRSTRNNEEILGTEAANLYKCNLEIDTKKLKDLQDLCKKGTIPTSYHEYYMNLTASSHDVDVTEEDD